MGTVKQFAEQNHIRMSHEYTEGNPFWDSSIPANHYKVTLRCQGRQYALSYSMGIGIGREPTIEDVLDCLASDAAGVENARSFEEWAGDYGYDSDSIKALKVYRACESTAKNLRRLIGNLSLYHELLYDTERL